MRRVPRTRICAVGSAQGQVVSTGRPLTRAAVGGLPDALGVDLGPRDRAVDVAVYSKHATCVRLLLLADRDDETPPLGCSLEPLVHESRRIWRCRVGQTRVASCRDHGDVVGVRHPAARAILPRSPSGRFIGSARLRHARRTSAVLLVR
jgi:hypothetical protein